MHGHLWGPCSFCFLTGRYVGYVVGPGGRVATLRSLVPTEDGRWYGTVRRSGARNMFDGKRWLRWATP